VLAALEGAHLVRVEAEAAGGGHGTALGGVGIEGEEAHGPSNAMPGAHRQ
jgi:hypothetical protein